MDKLKMQTVNKVDENVERIAALFPNCVTESIGADGKPTRVVDFDLLRQELSGFAVEGQEERYQFTWADKKKSILLANSPINKTLRPCREESVNFDTTKNLYIEGDNLDVLKLLQETYMGKIDTIYIDPPYNTGNNIIYRNHFFQSASDYLEISGDFDEDNNMLVLNPSSNGRYHTDWLNMFYPRLKLAKGLLSENGIIVVTIDDYEIDNTKKILDEIFGAESHLATIVIKNNPSGRSTLTGASIAHEYALFYGANNQVVLGRLPRNDKQISRYKEADTAGAYEWVNFRKHGGYREEAPTMYYPIYIKKDGTAFRIPKMDWSEERKEYVVREQPSDDELVSYPLDENNRERRWKWSLERALSSKDEMAVRVDRIGIPAVYIKSRMNEEGMLPLTVWDEKKYSSTEYGTNLLIDLLGDKLFDYPKSLYAVEDCLRIACKSESGIILDFFSGSSTTAHAVMKLNAENGGVRRFIMVQVPEDIPENSIAKQKGYKNICEIGKKRISCAGQKVADENRMIAPNLDIGFRVLKIDSSNMKPVFYNPNAVEQSLISQFEDNIKDDRTPEDLLFQVMLDMGVDLSSPITVETLGGKKVFTVGGDNLICCFDKDITKDAVTEIAKRKPLYAVFRDSSFSRDDVMVSFDQIFETYSPTTVRKVL